MQCCCVQQLPPFSSSLQIYTAAPQLPRNFIAHRQQGKPAKLPRAAHNVSYSFFGNTFILAAPTFDQEIVIGMTLLRGVRDCQFSRFLHQVAPTCEIQAVPFVACLQAESISTPTTTSMSCHPTPMHHSTCSCHASMFIKLTCKVFSARHLPSLLPPPETSQQVQWPVLRILPVLPVLPALIPRGCLSVRPRS